jgi:hypothetical protein
VRRQYVEQRAGGPIVHVEVAPGVVTIVAAWMLDPAACVGMEIGVPRVALSALIDLHRLLRNCGFARSSRDDSTTIPEEQHEEPVDIDLTAVRNATPAEHDTRFHAASTDERLGTRNSASLDFHGALIG